jgi:hypothetical protein
MSKFGEELIKKIREASNDWLWVEDLSMSLEKALFYGEVYGEKEFSKVAKWLYLDKMELLDSHGGEGQGDSYWRVYRFTKDSEVAHLKFDGWYASYSGPEFNETIEVTPREITVTVYE